MGMAAIWVMWHEPFIFTFIPSSHGGSTWNLASISLAVSKEKKFENVWIWMSLEQGQWMTLTFDFHIGSWYHLVNSIYQLWYHRLQYFLKNPLFYLFSHTKVYGIKKGQGQPRVIIWTNLVVLEQPMLHTNFHRPFGSNEEDFLRFLPYIGMTAILVMWPLFPHPKEAPYEIWF